MEKQEYKLYEPKQGDIYFVGTDIGRISSKEIITEIQRYSAYYSKSPQVIIGRLTWAGLTLDVRTNILSYIYSSNTSLLTGSFDYGLMLK